MVSLVLYMDIQVIIKQAISGALVELGLPVGEITLEHPVELSHGDYATNVAMALAKQAGESPKALAENIVTKLLEQKPDSIETVSVAGPGFINFSLSQKFFISAIPEILKTEEQFGKTNILAGKKILVEHSSPNLFKPFHIGHMMNNAIGESLARIMKYSGAEVVTMSFPSDISLGVAKAIFILLEKFENEFTPTDIAVLGDAYVEGTQRYENDESIHTRVKEIADNLYAGKQSDELALFEKCKQFNISYFESITAKLGSSFDSYIYESEAGIVGKEIVGKHTPSVFTESEGAIVYIPEESKKHLNTAVFINSQGNPTYEAKDIGLLSLKFDRVYPDTSIFVTDYQQIPHFQIVLDAAEKINPEWAEKSVHVPHGRMSFKGQKMSSRLGGVPLATDMITAVHEEVRERSPESSDELADQIAIGAIKFAILRAKPGQNINFDPDTSLSFEGDSGPYLQYTHARIQSLIEKGAALGITPTYNAEEVSGLEKMLYRFPEIIEHAISEYAPQYIVTYLIEIARAFNSYYGMNKIIDDENREVSAHRLALARATQIILKNGLFLLGISAPEKM
jgi:arginyl-tRNA synthetase